MFFPVTQRLLGCRGMPIESTIELFHLVSLYLYQQWRKEEVVEVVEV